MKMQGQNMIMQDMKSYENARPKYDNARFIMQDFRNFRNEET